MLLLNNQRAEYDYILLDKFDAGIELLGTEVKSVRNKLGSLRGARVLVRGGEAYLVGASIPAWQHANAPKDYDPERPRKILLTRKEIMQITNAENTTGLTSIPLMVKSQGRYLKISIAIARGKKKSDKRATIRERDEKRDIARGL